MTDKDTPIDVDQMMTIEEIDAIDNGGIALHGIKDVLMRERDYHRVIAMARYAVTEMPRLETIAGLNKIHVEKIADLEADLASCANRDQRMREALEETLNDFGLYSHASVKMASEALHFHPADSDAQAFVEGIKAEVLRQQIDWLHENWLDGVGPIVAAHKFAAEHGIKIESE